jgi:cytochrome d ubiquinol oxidase subunit II
VVRHRRDHAGRLRGDGRLRLRRWGAASVRGPDRHRAPAGAGGDRPFWDGNECSAAAADALPSPFRRLAAGLSGFYLAIFLVLWTLILRGIAIEFRSHHAHVLWRAAWDVVFGVASTALPILFGAALGNLLRGLPLDPDGWFSLPLFTDFTAGGEVGILDWYPCWSASSPLLAVVGHGGRI